jgi:hypothetical protein
LPGEPDIELKSQRRQRAQDEHERGARLAPFYFDDPLSTHAHALRQLVLIQAELAAVVANEKTEVLGSPSEHGDVTVRRRTLA